MSRTWAAQGQAGVQPPPYDLCCLGSGEFQPLHVPTTESELTDNNPDETARSWNTIQNASQMELFPKYSQTR